MYIYTFTYNENYFLYTFKLIINIYRIIIYRPIHLQYVGTIIYRGPQPIIGNKHGLHDHDPEFLCCGDVISDNAIYMLIKLLS